MRLTDNPRPDLHPAWHPFGRYIVFSQFARAEEELTTESNYGLAILDTSDRRAVPIRLTFDRAQETRASWSPDGNRLAFYFSERVEATSVRVGVLDVIYEAETDVPVRARLIETGAGRSLAHDVLPSDRNGPVWIPDPLVTGRGHSLGYRGCKVFRTMATSGNVYTAPGSRHRGKPLVFRRVKTVIVGF